MDCWFPYWVLILLSSSDFPHPTLRASLPQGPFFLSTLAFTSHLPAQASPPLLLAWPTPPSPNQPLQSWPSRLSGPVFQTSLTKCSPPKFSSSSQHRLVSPWWPHNASSDVGAGMTHMYVEESFDICDKWVHNVMTLNRRHVRRLFPSYLAWSHYNTVDMTKEKHRDATPEFSTQHDKTKSTFPKSLRVLVSTTPK